MGSNEPGKTAIFDIGQILQFGTKDIPEFKEF